MILKAAEPTEYTEIYDMVDKAFKGAELPSKIIKVTTIEDANFQKEDLRVVKVDGKIVSAMMIIRRPLRIGTAIVKGAIVAPVATHPDYQGKGYCSNVMRDAVQYMKAQGFDITILWGIPWLYPHYGYSPSMLRSEIVIKPKYISPLEKVSYESRALIEADLEKITHIYHSNTAMRTCAELRAPAIWEWKPGGAEVKFEVFTDEKGEVVGYCSLGTDWGRPCAHEIGVLNNEACGFIFNHLLKIAKQKTVEEFYCLVHPEHPFTRFAFWRNGEI
jgi:predicted N-acetyltransferase YhbS